MTDGIVTKLLPGLADQFARFYESITAVELPVRVRLWDGSEAGHPDGPVIVFSGPVVVRRLLRHPNQLGFANAYICGEVDAVGDIVEALRRLRPAARPSKSRLLRALPHGLALIGRLATARPQVNTSLPAVATVFGRRNTRERDRAIIAHHYDLSNEFYELILGPTMAYSCALWTSDSDDCGLDDAQLNKLDLICQKLQVRAGSRLLDLGCGWGSLAIHAARAYGARVTAVTLSGQQYRWIARAIGAAGLNGQVEVRLGHYETITDGPFDAISCIEMGEHVGRPRYPAFVAQLRKLLRPGGLGLVQQMSRNGRDPDGGAFIRAYITPDMDMRPLGRIVTTIENGGLEVIGIQGLREHYARTTLASLHG